MRDFFFMVFFLVLKGKLLIWIYLNVMWLGENECLWWVKWKLWLMVSCGFY